MRLTGFPSVCVSHYVSLFMLERKRRLGGSSGRMNLNEGGLAMAGSSIREKPRPRTAGSHSPAKERPCSSPALSPPTYGWSLTLRRTRNARPVIYPSRSPQANSMVTTTCPLPKLHRGYCILLDADDKIYKIVERNNSVRRVPEQ